MRQVPPWMIGGGAGARIGAARAFPGPPARHAAAAAEVEPPPEVAVQTLESMGFDRARVIHALRIANNNVELAAQFLLEG